MSHTFTMPQLGSTMEEGTVVRWYKNEGDTITEGEVLLEIETDKSTMEVESPHSGVLLSILVPTDSVVPVRQPIALIGQPGETPSDVVTERPGSMEMPLLAVSPRARRTAAERGVDISLLTGKGTGVGGRIIESDVLALAPVTMPPVEKRGTRSTPLAARIADDLGISMDSLNLGLPGSRVRREHVMSASEETINVANQVQPEVQVIPIAGMRKRIADNISLSAFSAPHVTLTLEVDMTECVNFRTKILPEFERRYATRVSITEMIVKTVAIALESHPRLNARLVSDSIHIHKNINIGIAVALEEGLVVPVVKYVQNKNLGGISQESKELIERARTGKFVPDDLSDGTFTITNLGSFDIDVFDPVIVPGQAAILGIGRIAEKPAVVKGAIEIRKLMNLCLSFDHRMLDGAPAAKFLQSVKQLLENPISILI